MSFILSINSLDIPILNLSVISTKPQLRKKHHIADEAKNKINTMIHINRPLYTAIYIILSTIISGTAALPTDEASKERLSLLDGPNDDSYDQEDVKED